MTILSELKNVGGISPDINAIQTHPNKTAYGHMTIGGDFLFKNKCEFYLEFTIVKI